MIGASELYNLDTETGQLIWKPRPQDHFFDRPKWLRYQRHRCGKPAGTIDKWGYVKVLDRDGKKVCAHRVIWEMLNGPIAEGALIDHIDRVRHNNRPSNLRLADDCSNGWNRGKHRNNKSGIKGVSWNKRRGKWISVISHNRKTLTLGFFDSKGMAAVAYAKAALRFHGQFAKLSLSK